MTERFDAATVTAVIDEGRRHERPSAEIPAEILALAADSAWAKGVGNPVRARIVRLLREHGELSPTGAATELDGVPLGTVAYHFRHLRKHGLIELCDTIPRRGTVEHVYRLSGSTS